MKDPLFDLRAKLSQVIEETKIILKQSRKQSGSAYSQVSTTWLPLSQSLLAKGYSGHRSTKTPSTLISEPPSTQSTPPSPQVTGSFSIKETRSSLTKEDPVKEPTSSTQIVPQVTPQESKSARKLGRFLLQPPVDTSTDVSEVIAWLNKKGLFEPANQGANANLRLATSKKIALSPVVIFHAQQTLSLEALQRLRQAIEDRFLPCCLISEELAHTHAILEALERHRIECLIYENSLQAAHELSRFEQTLKVESLDLIEKNRKVELWKKLVQLLGKGA